MFISGYANTEKVFYCFYKIASSKNYNAGKDKKKTHFTDQYVSSYNINLTIGFLNCPIKTYISKSGDGVFTTRVSLCHTTELTYSHATTPLGQSERSFYLSYFIKYINFTFLTQRSVLRPKSFYRFLLCDNYHFQVIKDSELERFSNDCRKTKTKAITPTNHNRSRQRDEPITIPSNYL